jgi:hypothetical protein
MSNRPNPPNGLWQGAAVITKYEPEWPDARRTLNVLAKDSAYGSGWRACATGVPKCPTCKQRRAVAIGPLDAAWFRLAPTRRAKKEK